LSAIDTLLKLLNEHQVEIPIVQRDYAQGRNDEHSISVRKSLLWDIRSALEGNGALDLNFIYGKIQGDKFIPLDGQQRLTTLFLVHLFAFANDETKTDLLTRFTYETRTSSRAFLEHLTKHRAAVLTTAKPSKEIVDTNWYQSAWDYDPTVQSVKVVLDDIVDILGDVTDLSDKLSAIANPPIRFSFLPMDKLGMEDSLYIKMNARGKMLTPFENFKARLISQVQKLYESKELTIEPHVYERLLDGDWTDLFWKKDRNNFDTYYKAFFDIIFASIANLSYDSKYISDVKLEDLTAEMVETAYYLLNYLCSKICQKEVHSIVFNCLIQRPSFQQRMMFYAVSVYMLRSMASPVNDSLNQWLRIIRNLINNTNENAVGRAENFGAAIQSINALSEYWENLTALFATKTISLKIFAPPQIEEEETKAILICRSPKFAAMITDAESHAYFSGQIRSALMAAGITREIARKSDEATLREKMNLFDLYWSKIAALFTDKEPVFGTLLRQALLTQKDYTLKTGNYYSFGVDNPNDPVSLKALFADADQPDLIRYLLDSFPTSATEDIKKSLQNTISNAIVAESDWRYCFIKYPALFNRMSKQYMRIYKGANTLIVKNMATNGYNFEVFTFTLHQILGTGKSTYADVYGSYGQYSMTTTVAGKKVNVWFEDNNFVITDEEWNGAETEDVVFITEKEPFSEILHFLNQGGIN